MDERNSTTDLAEGPSRSDHSSDEAWSPGTVVTDEERWRAGLQNEIRPLVERCRRLRDRGLLD